MRHNARPLDDCPPVIEPDPGKFAADYARWFRGSTPYVSTHQGKTFVVWMSGESLAGENCINIIHDLALVSVLGVRLVLVHGARPQLSAALEGAGYDCPLIEGTRVTPAEAMDEVRHVCAGLRSQIEGLFSQGLPQTPLHNTRISVLGGNLVTARPMGTISGVNYQHTGVVRRVNAELIQQLVGPGRIVLLSPLGYSPWGELYNLESEQLAASTAEALKADKLILFTCEDRIEDAEGKRLSEIEPQEVKAGLERLACAEDTRRSLSLAADLSQKTGISCHLIGRSVDGALLQELFTAEGQGTRVSRSLGSRVRDASIKDLPAILAMTAPLAEQGVLKARDAEVLEKNIQDFLVTEVDGLVAGCCALSLIEGQGMVELSCLAVHANFRDSSAGDALLEAAIARAKRLGACKLLALTTQAQQWFKERGFVPTQVESLAKSVRHQCQARGSIALVKSMH